MKLTPMLIIKSTVVLFCLFNITACSDEESGSSSSSSGGGGIDGTPVGEVETTGFWLNSKSTQHPIFVNKSTGFGDNCFISATSNTNEVIDCYIDVLEGDLYMNDISLQYNAPPNLCEHVSVHPAWHWNYSSGYGPSRIVLNINSAGPEPVVTGCTATMASGGTVNCSAHPELEDVTNPAGPRCVYDKSGYGQKNCCFGNTTTVKRVNDGTNTVETTIPSSWGGEPGSCIGGSIVNSWDNFEKTSKLPATWIYSVPKATEANPSAGLNQELKLIANGASKHVWFSFHANAYETSATYALGTNPHAHNGYVTGTTSNKPYAVEPLDDLDGSPMRSGSDAYVFTCYDGGFEVKHEIRAYIREWNTLTEFLAYESSKGSSYNPDVEGTEGVDCDYDSGFGGACNDRTDLDDILWSLGAPYDTDNTDPDAAAIRETYFPNVFYD